MLHLVAKSRLSIAASALLVSLILPSLSFAGPTILPDPTDGFDWDSNINQNALRFVDVGAADIIPQDGSDAPWVDEGLWAQDYNADLDLGIWNKSKNDSFDGLILMISYRGLADDFSFEIAYPQLLSSSSGSGDVVLLEKEHFLDPSTYGILGPGSTRPGGGFPTLNTTEGIVFVDLGETSALGPKGTLNAVFQDFEGANLSDNFALLFDVYGYVEGNSPFVIKDTNPNSSDLVVTNGGDPVPEASTMLLFGSGAIGLFGVMRRKGWIGGRS
ncbi:MAG: PEP-CTERM sorting domain-containing protein [bacterium]|nr:PEP-CTERM sorting domain-containing protein [bacterium]